MLNLHALLHSMYVMTACIGILTPANFEHVRPRLALSVHVCLMFLQRRHHGAHRSGSCTLSRLQSKPPSIDSGSGNGDGDGDGDGLGDNYRNGDGAAFIDGEAAEASHARLKSLSSLEDSKTYDSDDGAGNQSKPSSKRPRNCLDDDDDDLFM